MGTCTQPLFSASEIGVSVDGQGAQLLSAHRGDLVELINQSSVVHLTGFEASNQNLRDFVLQFCDELRPYIGATHNRVKVDGVDGHLLVPPKWMGMGVPAHAEGTYTRKHPLLLVFRCIRPAVFSGETTIYDGAAIFDELAPALRRKFESTRICYTQQFPEAMWPDLYETTELSDVLAIIDGLGIEASVESAEGGGRLVKTSYSCFAWQEDRFDRRPAFVNHIFPSVEAEKKGNIFPTQMRVRWEGAPDEPFMSEQAMRELYDAAETWARPVSWVAGDIVIVDNTRAMHGVRSYFGNREMHLIMTDSPKPDFGFQQP